MDISFYVLRVFIIIVLSSPSNAALNDPCSGNVDCTDVNGICGSDKTCVCNTNQYVSGNICAHKISVRNICSNYEISGLECPCRTGFTSIDGLCFRDADIDCGTLQNPNSATTITYSPGTKFEGVATYTCAEGYVITGSNIKTCGSSGTWSGNVPACLRRDCGELQNLNSVTISYSPDTKFESVATYACDGGYFITGSNTRTCGSSGTWSGSAPACSRRDCGELQNPNSATITYSPDTKFEGVAIYACDGGYFITGSNTRTCGSSGTWSGNAPACSRRDCGTLQNPNSATITYSPDTKFEGVATYACDGGYFTTGSNTRTCGSSGTWSGNAPACSRRDCGELQNSNSASITYSPDTKFEGVATYACDGGYFITGSNTRTCGSSGTWSGNAPACSRRDCGELQNSNSATITYSPDTKFEGVATYTCDGGYFITGSNTRTCGSSGTWSGNAPACSRRDCGSLQSANTATITYSPDTKFGGVATYTCDGGYFITGSNTRTCGSSRTWSGNAPACSRRDCGAIPASAVVFGTVTLTSETTTTYLATATVSCNKGYETSTTQISCQSEGQWSTAVCTIKNCGAIPASAVVFGTATLTSETTTTYLATATVSCNKGYETSTTQISCQSEGRWSTAVCTIKNCGQPSDPANGDASFTQTTFEATATYTCNAGYIVTGTDEHNFTITCTASGVWSVTYPTCGFKADPLGSACQNSTSTHILPGEMCSGNDYDCLPRTDNNQDYTCQCVTGFYDTNGNTEAGNCSTVEELRVESISFTSVTTSAMTVSWTPPTTTHTFITGYVVEWRQNGNTISNDTSGTLASTNYVINSGKLISGRTYIVKIISQNTISYTSTVQTTSVVKEQALQPQKPGIIFTQSSDLDASDQTIEVVWTAPDGYVDMYEVRLIEDGATLSSNTSKTSTVLITYNQIENGHRYNVSVSAVSETFDGSNVETSETNTEEIKTIVKVPSKPRFVVCHMTTDTSVTIRWNASLIPNGDLMEYRIYTHFYLNDASVRNDSTEDTDLEYEITGLQQGSYYYYYVSTVNEEYESGLTRLTDSFCATMANVADAPNNLNVSNIKSQSFVVSWTKPTNTFGEHMGYIVQVSNSDDQCVIELIRKCYDCIQTFEISALENPCPAGVSTEEPLSKTSIDSVDSQSYIVTTLNPDISYTVSVTAVNDAGRGILASVTIQTYEEVPQKPKDITVLGITPNSCNVNWDIDEPRPGATTFDVIISPSSPATFDDIQLTGFDRRSQTLSGLEEFWDYNVTIRASTSKGSMESDTILFQTLSAAPGTVDDFEVIPAGPGGDYTKINVKWKIPVLLERNSEIIRFDLLHNTSTDANSRTLTLEKNPDTAYVYQVILNVTPAVTYEFKVYAINADNKNGTEVQKIVTAPTAEESGEEGGSDVVIISIVVVAAVVVLVTFVVVTKWVLRWRRIAKIAHTGSEINDAESNIHREGTRQVNSAMSANLTSKMTSEEIMTLLHVNIFSNCRGHFKQNTGEHISDLSMEDFQNIFGAAEGVSLFNRLRGRENDASAVDPQMNDEYIETHHQYKEVSDTQHDDVSYENIEMVTPQF